MPFIQRDTAWEDMIEDLEKRRKGEIKPISTGFPGVDKVYFDGWETGWIVSIAGRSGTGKTALADQIINQMPLANDMKIAYIVFSFEMRPARLIRRMVCRKYKIAMRDLISLNAKKKLTSAMMKEIKSIKTPLMNETVSFVERPMNDYEIRSHIVKYRKKLDKAFGKGVPLVCVIDHLLLSVGGTQKQGIDDVVLMQNELKKEDPNILFINLTQINRNYDMVEREDPEKPFKHYPIKSDIYGSDVIWFTSDSIIALANPYKRGMTFYGPKKYATYNPKTGNPYVFGHHLKNRDAGEGGEITPFEFVGENYEFVEKDRIGVGVEESKDEPI